MKLIFSTLLLVLQVLPSVHAYGRGSSYNPLANLMKRSTAYTEVDNHHFHVHIQQQEGFKLKDKITTLPGQPIVQYSGYITVDPNSGRALFYYFTESEDSAAKPLVLWLNGGNCFSFFFYICFLITSIIYLLMCCVCSSLGAGAMTELGPFRVHADGETLWLNKGAWNKLANLIFLESPAGVGFSYSNTTADYAASGDGRRFPEYKNRAFYITGETQLILERNPTVINLKGIAIGINAYIHEEDMNNGLFEFYWRHTLLPDEIHKGIEQNCNFSLGANLTALCEDYSAQATEAIGKIFPYDIYAPTCSSSSSQTNSGYDPCSDQYVNAYLNKPEVQKALHANIGPWEVCSDSIGSMWLDSPLTVLPTIKELMSTGIRVWIYSGDTDAVVPVTTTSLSLPKLTVGTKTPWYPWYNQGSEGEVGGYAVEYENITFVTVKGAGHFVPSYKPESALTLFASFLDGKLRKKPTP
ncbi:hypothetical protein ACJIZ3_018850 [Penstemon smallii]|uniref:Serine carboxypeptidase n=1 Tax=Penstemon smallii TaxID=265156 RepID=A0ABD3T035_9LAMI